MKSIALTLSVLFIIITSCKAQSDDNFSILDNFIPSGYMGDTSNIMLQKYHSDFARPDSTCAKIISTPGNLKWAGIYWQFPANNWCKQKGMDFSKSGFKKITFYVKGEKGGEEVKFKSGHDCGDSYVTRELTIRLKRTWQKLTLDLTGKDLSNITGAFCWVVDSKANVGVVTFYIDDVQFEK
jgi:hypothetical protein